MCVLLSALPFLVFMPMSLMGSIEEIKISVSDLQSYPEGTSSFKQDRHHAMLVGSIAICLDILACAVVWGLIAIAFNVISRQWQIVTWIASIIAGFGAALLRLGYIGASTDKNFVIMVIIIPALVAGASVFGLILSCYRQTPASKSLAN